MPVSPSLFDRLARRPASRVTTRLAERLSEGDRDGGRRGRGRVCWRLRRRFRCRGDEGCEKLPRKPRQWLHVFAMTNRVWQVISSLIMFSIYSYLVFNVKSDTAPGQIRLAAVRGIAIPSVAYHVNVALLVLLLHRSTRARGLRFLSYLSVVGDFWMMGLAMSKLSILSAAGVTNECHNQGDMNIFKTMINNGAAFARSHFGWGAHHNHAEIDLACCLPKVIYMLCAIAIFSYTFSVLLTSLQLQSGLAPDAQTPTLGHVEEAIPERLEHMRGLNPSYPFSIPPRLSGEAAPPLQVYSVAIPAHPYPASRRSTSEDLPRYASVEEPPLPTPRGRLSQETTSSFNPDLYLVSDGFRPQPEPPNYSSRPPSYRSGPPSVRNV